MMRASDNIGLKLWIEVHAAINEHRDLTEEQVSKDQLLETLARIWRALATYDAAKKLLESIEQQPKAEA